jgi:hypothetical protein
LQISQNIFQADIYGSIVSSTLGQFNKRITMTEFKVGDWVRTYSCYISDKNIKNNKDQIKLAKLLSMEIIDDEEIIFYINKDKTDWITVYSDGSLRDFKIWEPEVGECCWCDTIGLVQVEGVSNKSNQIVVRILFGNNIHNTIVDIKQLEPFIGELPSFIKETK